MNNSIKTAALCSLVSYALGVAAIILMGPAAVGVEVIENLSSRIEDFQSFQEASEAGQLGRVVAAYVIGVIAFVAILFVIMLVYAIYVIPIASIVAPVALLSHLSVFGLALVALKRIRSPKIRAICAAVPAGWVGVASLGPTADPGYTIQNLGFFSPKDLLTFQSAGLVPFDPTSGSIAIGSSMIAACLLYPWDPAR